MYNINTWIIFHTRISSVAGIIDSIPQIVGFSHLIFTKFSIYPLVFFTLSWRVWQAKMGMTEDFEASLQVLRGFDTDISAEVHEIKVPNCNHLFLFWFVGGGRERGRWRWWDGGRSSTYLALTFPAKLCTKKF